VKRTRATYDLPEEIIKKIIEISVEKQVPIYQIAKSFLEFSIQEFCSGNIILITRPNRSDIKHEYEIVTWKKIPPSGSE
jgi:hypothetical protein